MTLLSRLLGLLFRLPPAETYNVAIDRDLKITMPDGAVLLADHYYPRGSEKPPTILVRSPYGRSGPFALLFAHPYAERGFQVLIQSCRGTFGSGGTFDAFRNEHGDGLATVAWLQQQPWFSGQFATAGPSYLGFTQWSLVGEAGPNLKAMAVQISASEVRSLTYAGESFGLDNAFTWLQTIFHQEESGGAQRAAQRREPELRRKVFAHLPIQDLDTLSVGQRVKFYQDWLVHHQPNDPWWQVVDFSETVPQFTMPIYLQGGWYDIFLPYQLQDYARLRAAGGQPYLTIGPWNHVHLQGLATMVRESIVWFRAHLLNDKSRLRAKSVRINVMGINEWREYDSWPPPGYTPQAWHLQAGRRLAPDSPIASAPDTYRYDPADPTPAIGGMSLSDNSGPKDNRALEARPDVMCYDSDRLTQAVEVIGAVTATLYVKSTLEHTDFFARLCDVAPNGKSINICDGLLRLVPGRPAPQADGSLKITVELWPTAYCFKAGHRIRLQLSSGSHPRYARNPGSGEPLGTATQLRAADQTIFHDPDHPSAIVLPVNR
jgi:putative CocE/NonD family hydrolase